MEWEVYLTTMWTRWRMAWPTLTVTALVVAGIEVLAEVGPNLGRPLVDRIKGSRLHNLKELRPGSAGSGELRVLSTFDPWRSAILLVAGDKSGNWSNWYRRAIPQAESLYDEYLRERAFGRGTVMAMKKWSTFASNTSRRPAQTSLPRRSAQMLARVRAHTLAEVRRRKRMTRKNRSPKPWA